MRVEWDNEKNRRNSLKHQLSFETATLVFDDPDLLAQPDPFSEDEERWIALGALQGGTVLFVVHKWIDRGDQEAIRIISARKATPRERGVYEETKQTAKTRHRRAGRHERRRH